PHRLVVRPAIVVARDSKEPGKGEDDQRRREGKQGRPPTWFWSEPRVRRAAEQFRGVEGRQVRAERVVRVLERGPGGVNEKRREKDRHDGGLNPPGVLPHGELSRALENRELRVGHAIPSGGPRWSLARVRA